MCQGQCCSSLLGMLGLGSRAVCRKGQQASWWQILATADCHVLIVCKNSRCQVQDSAVGRGVALLLKLLAAAVVSSSFVFIPYAAPGFVSATPGRPGLCPQHCAAWLVLFAMCPMEYNAARSTVLIRAGVEFHLELRTCSGHMPSRTSRASGTPRPTSSRRQPGHHLVPRQAFGLMLMLSATNMCRATVTAIAFLLQSN